jgi:hypothetical protein
VGTQQLKGEKNAQVELAHSLVAGARIYWWRARAFIGDGRLHLLVTGACIYW